MRYKEILPKLVVILFGLTLYLYGVYESSRPFWDCGLDDTVYPAHLESLRIGQVFCWSLFFANLCFALYLKAEEKLAVFPCSVAMVSNVMITFGYTKEIAPSFESIILWMPHFIAGELFERTAQESQHSHIYTRLSFLSLSGILLFCFLLVNRNFIIPYLHRLAAARALSNK